MQRKKLGLIMLVIMIILTELAGCSSNTGKKGIDTKKMKLTVAVWDNEIVSQFQPVTEAFMAKYPNVEVRFIEIQTDEYSNKLSVLLAGGNQELDVIFIKDADDQITLKEKGQLLNLDEYIKRDKLRVDYYSEVAELLKIGGSNYTLPFRKDCYVLFYNKNLFDKRGIPYPKSDITWEEYEELAQQMTFGEGEEKVYGTHHHTWMAVVANWALQDGKNTLISNNYFFLEPYYEQALRMQRNGIVENYAKLKMGSIHYASMFEQQKCAMLPMGSWFIGALIQDKKAGLFDFEWSMTRIPHPEGIEVGSSVGSITPVGINAKSKQKELAWEYIKFVAGEEGAKVLADNGILPAIHSQEIIKRLVAVEGYPKDGAVALDITNFVLDRPIDTNMTEVRRIIEEEHDLIMIEAEDIETGIRHMNTGVAGIKGQ